jgi:hypothetical protein
VNARTILNDPDGGAGTVFVDGGNLTVNGNVSYDASTVTSLSHLASLGWIVIDNGTGTKGNVYIDGDVTTVSGAFFVGGDDGVYTVAPPEIDSPSPLTVYGLMLAREFHLGRSYKDKEQGAERFIYDGRAVVNPPPGFADVTKALPSFRDTLPQ